MTAPLTPGSSLNAARRAREFAALESDPIDVLVIGGGVTGAGVALDAASRGLSVVLAEKHDLAFGTSRWSSKLVHGGLRYLATGQVAIAHESAVERDIMMRHTAPHLVRPFRQLLPLLPSVSRLDSVVSWAGFAAGDTLRAVAGTPGTVLPHVSRIPSAEALALIPGLRRDGLRGAVMGWDGQLYDDARLVIGLARTAAAHGARVLTRCAVTEATGSGAVLTDTLTGTRRTVSARVVINATGVWAGEVADHIKIRPSRGTHLVFPGEVFGGLTTSFMVAIPGTFGRYVFALPAPDDKVYVGLTDEDAPGPVPDVPAATEDEIDFLLSVINLALARPVGREDMLSTFSGLRPLIEAEGATADVSRKHAVITSPDGLVTITGGKLTTYRRMAEDALDVALAHHGVAAGPCRTRRLPLVGAAPRAELAQVDGSRHLVAKYGTEAGVVTTMGSAEPVCPGTHITAAEFAFGVRHEGALDVEDLLERRTRLDLDPAVRAAATPAARAAIAAAEVAAGATARDTAAV